MLWSAAPAASIPVLPPTLPQSPEAMAKAAAAEPEKYRDILLNCAAAQGVVAMVKGRAGMSSKGHDEMAILLMHVATLLPPKDELAVTTAYGDKLFAFNQALQDDKTGTVQFDLLKLTQACSMAEQYAAASLADKEEQFEQHGAEVEPVNPIMDDKTREDIIAELMGTKSSEPATPPPPPQVELLPSEKKIVAGIFADLIDEPTGYAGMLTDCAAFHGLRAAFQRLPKKREEHKAKETLFLDAVRGVTPFAPVAKNHIENVEKYKQYYIADKSGKFRNEMNDMADKCAAMEGAAKERVALPSGS